MEFLDQLPNLKPLICNYAKIFRHENLTDTISFAVVVLFDNPTCSGLQGAERRVPTYGYDG